jgi:GT2 family glycosyltransferase
MIGNASGTLSIVIVNWNAGPALIDCVKSIASYSFDVLRSVVLVDNGSTDGSVEPIEALRDLPFELLVIRNHSNIGFAAACNQGAAAATACDYLLFLNPDTKLLSDSLTTPLAFLQQPSNSQVGICGIRLSDETGNFSTSAARFPTLRIMAGKILGLSRLLPTTFPQHFMTSTELTNSGPVDQVIGAFFLIRRRVFDLCGGFDQRFFVYFEEVDLSLRAKKLGFYSYFLSNASAVHIGGGCSERIKATRLFYSLRSRLLFGEKHYSRPAFLALTALTAFELPLRLLVARSFSDRRNTVRAYSLLTAAALRRIR